MLTHFVREIFCFYNFNNQPIVRRSLEISLAGWHNILFFGPPSSDKSIAAHLLHKAYFGQKVQNKIPIIATFNPCPCGNLGLANKVCRCRKYDIKDYWKKVLDVHLDKFDMRVPVESIQKRDWEYEKCRIDENIIPRLKIASDMQEKRFSNESYSRNGSLYGDSLKRYCKLDNETRLFFLEAVNQMALSDKACLSIMKISRTIADLNGCKNIERDHFLEALYYRRFGGLNFFWKEF